MKLSLLTYIILVSISFSSFISAQPTPDKSDWTKVEKQVYELISNDGLYIVHFWATWCHNSRSEFVRGIWPKIIEENEDIEFIFVTIRDKGNTGDDFLARYNIPDRVLKLGQPKVNDGVAGRNRIFMDLPSYWTPTTWVFHKNGKLAYAINNG